MKKYAIILIVVSVILILSLTIGLSVGLRKKSKKNKKNKVASASNACAADANCFVVTVAGGVFHIDGAAPSNGAITLTRGVTYTFDQSDSSNSGQPNLDILDLSVFNPSLPGNPPYNNNGECSSCVTFNGTPGQSGASTVFALPSNNSVNLRYGSGSTNMGANFNIVDP